MKTRMITTYGFSGVTTFVIESPTRYAACVSSGLMPTCMNIGTKTGAKNAYFADIEPMNRFPIATTATKVTIRTGAGRSARASRPPPAIALISPRPE